MNDTECFLNLNDSKAKKQHNQHISSNTAKRLTKRFLLENTFTVWRKYQTKILNPALNGCFKFTQQSLIYLVR